MAKRKSKIQLRSGRDLDGLREAGSMAATILQRTSELVKKGVTTGEIDRAASELMAENSCVSAFLGYKGFPGHICISVNEEVVHGIGGKRTLRDGDVVKIDVGILTKNGWIGDNAKSVLVCGSQKTAFSDGGVTIRGDQSCSRRGAALFGLWRCRAACEHFWIYGSEAVCWSRCGTQIA